MFAGNFPPNGWLFCDGSLLPIYEYDTLFMLIGTTFGGDGVESFALPDLRGRVPLHQNADFPIGAMGGVEEVALTVNQLPVHNHPILASSSSAQSPSPVGQVYAAADLYTAPSGLAVNLNPQVLSSTGGSQPHTNMQPYLAVNFIISVFGIFPSLT